MSFVLGPPQIPPSPLCLLGKFQSRKLKILKASANFEHLIIQSAKYKRIFCKYRLSETKKTVQEIAKFVSGGVAKVYFFLKDFEVSIMSKP